MCQVSCFVSNTMSNPFVHNALENEKTSKLLYVGLTAFLLLKIANQGIIATLCTVSNVWMMGK
jgi:hypothetical protein